MEMVGLMNDDVIIGVVIQRGDGRVMFGLWNVVR